MDRSGRPAGGGEEVAVWLLTVPPYGAGPAVPAPAAPRTTSPESTLPGTTAPGAGDPDASVLDPAELRRARAFVRPADRARYVAAHAALRRVLAARLRVPAREVPFTRAPCARCGGPHGRPELAPPYSSLRFSLSHSGGLVLIAVSDAVVGADVQRVPPPGTVEACLPALHPAERAELAALPETDRCRAFARIWTRKEAYLKALGTGLCRPASLDYLGARAERRPPGWSLVDLPCGAGAGAAVAVRGPLAHPPVPQWVPAPPVSPSPDGP